MCLACSFVRLSTKIFICNANLQVSRLPDPRRVCTRENPLYNSWNCFRTVRAQVVKESPRKSKERKIEQRQKEGPGHRLGGRRLAHLSWCPPDIHAADKQRWDAASGTEEEQLEEPKNWFVEVIPHIRSLHISRLGRAISDLMHAIGFLANGASRA